MKRFFQIHTVRQWMGWGGFTLFILSSLLGCANLGLSAPPASEPRAPATATVRPPFTPRPTDTPWPTVTPLPTSQVRATPGNVDGVISTTVNVRQGPGIQYPVIAKLKPGTAISARGQARDQLWLVLMTPTGGWVHREFVVLGDGVERLAIVEAPPTPQPTRTSVPTAAPPTLSATSTPTMYVDFRADASWVIPGQCTGLRWDVEGVRGVYLNGQGQPGHGWQEVCPTQTQTFVLHVVMPAGYLDRALTITVLAPAPTPTKS